MLWLSGALGVPPKTWGGIDDLMLSLRECWQPLRLEQQLQLSMWMLAMLRTVVQCSLGRAIEPRASGVLLMSASNVLLMGRFCQALYCADSLHLVTQSCS